jgi:hypothetical protein
VAWGISHGPNLEQLLFLNFLIGPESPCEFLKSLDTGSQFDFRYLRYKNKTREDPKCMDLVDFLSCTVPTNLELIIEYGLANVPNNPVLRRLDK